MVEREGNKILVTEQDGKLVAELNSKRLAALRSIKYEGDEILRGMYWTIGAMSDEPGLVRRSKEYHKAGMSCVETEGWMPFGREPNLTQAIRFSAGRARFTSDFVANGETISRHFSVGSFLLPGKWESMFVVPAAQHLVDGGKPYERQLPKWDGKDIMLGHWHRPPLSLVFKRKSGVRLEVGTGSDVFRWEQNMGYHPEHGSYKVTLTQAGLEVLREPLACCEDFVPEGRPFRYTWHLAWDKAGVRSTPPEHEVVKAQVARNGHDLEWEKVKKAFAAPRTDDKPRFLLVDIMDFLWEDTCKRCPSPQAFAAELVAPEPCWMTSPVEKKLKNLIRKLVEIPGVGGLIFRNVSPGICYHPSHVDKKNPMGVAHWDMGGMMDFAAWARQACRDKFEVYSEAAEGWDTPAMNTLFD